MNGREYVIYLDVFFLLIFIVFYMIILITSKIIRKTVNKSRICLAAGFYGLYNVLILKPLFIHLINTVFLNVIAVAVVVFIAFGYGDIKKYLRNLLLTIVVTAGFLGVISYLYYFTIMGKYTRNVLCGSSNKVINGRRFMIASFMAYILLDVVVKILHRIRKNDTLFYDVKLTFNGKSVMAKALFDTGNSLVEPVSNKEVHVAEYELLKPIMEGDGQVEEKLCVIPFHSLGNERGLMYGIRIDEMVVIYQGKPVFFYNPVIGIYKGSVSNSGKYSVILNGNIDSKLKESRGDCNGS